MRLAPDLGAGVGLALVAAGREVLPRLLRQRIQVRGQLGELVLAVGCFALHGLGHGADGLLVLLEDFLALGDRVGGKCRAQQHGTGQHGEQ
ncbi:hypothetical protein D3C78_1660140 [compost metagenome]